MPAKVNKAESKVEIFKVIEEIWSRRTGGFENPVLKVVKKKKKKEGKRQLNV